MLQLLLQRMQKYETHVVWLYLDTVAEYVTPKHSLGSLPYDKKSKIDF